MLKAIIIDTETTGVDDPEVIELAWISPNSQDVSYYERFLPEKEISLGAMATHHIIPSDLTGCRPSSEIELPDVEYLIGHNVDFDWKALGSPDVKRICTLALSRWLFPEIDSHKQSAMMYHLYPHEEARQRCQGAHNALEDVKMCQMVLVGLRKVMLERGIQCGTYSELWVASEIARIPTVMSFGKHKGTKIKDIPADYKAWLLKQADVDPYLVIALRGQ